MNSDTPITDKLRINHPDDVPWNLPEFDGVVDAHIVQKMEQLLRKLRNHANNYVSPATLKEVDEFLNQTPQ